MAGRLDGKVALISGAARGQGEVEARLFVAEGARVVRPRLRGTAGLQQGILWLLQGLPPLDHALKRLPGDVMAGLLVPFQLLEPGATRVKIRGEGPLAAYLAYAAEYLGALQVVGFAGPSPWLQLPSFSTEGATTWDLNEPA